MGGPRNFIGLQVIATPATRTRRRSARAVERPFGIRTSRRRQQIRAVLVRTESNQITSEAFRTFHAMTNTPSHESPAPRATLSNVAPKRWTLSDTNGLHLDVFGPRLPNFHCGPKTSIAMAASEYDERICGAKVFSAASAKPWRPLRFRWF